MLVCCQSATSIFKNKLDTDASLVRLIPTEVMSLLLDGKESDAGAMFCFLAKKTSGEIPNLVQVGDILTWENTIFVQKKKSSKKS